MSTLNKVIIITGYSRGIGKEVAMLLANNGVKVVVNYSNSKVEAENTVNHIIENGGTAIAIQADVSDKEQILEPLDLNHTYGSIKDVDIDDVMSGYYVGYENDLKSDDVGSMLATAEDLGKFIRALNNGFVFADKVEQEIYESIYKFEHTGLIPGYQTIAKYNKDLDMVVIQFTNTVNFNGYNWNLSKVMYSRILKILHQTQNL